jgi:hypothetical protein
MPTLKNKEIPSTIIVLKNTTPMEIQQFADSLKNSNLDHCITNADIEIWNLDNESDEYVKITNKRPKISNRKCKEILNKVK